MVADWSEKRKVNSWLLQKVLCKLVQTVHGLGLPPYILHNNMQSSTYLMQASDFIHLQQYDCAGLVEQPLVIFMASG